MNIGVMARLLSHMAGQARLGGTEWPKNRYYWPKGELSAGAFIMPSDEIPSRMMG